MESPEFFLFGQRDGFSEAEIGRLNGATSQEGAHKMAVAKIRADGLHKTYKRFSIEMRRRVIDIDPSKFTQELVSEEQAQAIAPEGT